MRRMILSLIILLLPALGHAAPKERHVTLSKLTKLTVHIYPGLGTRFIFPFVLDEADTKDSLVPFTLVITNPAFSQIREKGRNSLVVKTDAAGKYVAGDMFVTVGGYEITVELRSTTSIDEHYTDIVFDLGDKERENLIQRGIAQRTKALEQQYQQKIQELEKTADRRAMARVGALALQKPHSSNIKEEGRLKLTNGDTITLYVDEMLQYGPYNVYVFELESRSKTQGFAVIDAKLSNFDPQTKHETFLDAATEMPARIMPDSMMRGTLTTMQDRADPKSVLKLQVVTDKGTLEAQW